MAGLRKGPNSESSPHKYPGTNRNIGLGAYLDGLIYYILGA